MFVIPITLPDKSGQFSRMLLLSPPSSNFFTRRERERDSAGKRQRCEKRRRGAKLCGHYPVFPRWPSTPTASTGLGSRNNGKREQRGFSRDKEAAAAWL